MAGESHRLPSGPLHDAAEVARAGVPTVMLFVQSLRGLSHTKLEDTKEQHLELSVQALDRLAESGCRFAVCTNKLEGLSVRLLDALARGLTVSSSRCGDLRGALPVLCELATTTEIARLVTGVLPPERLADGYAAARQAGAGKIIIRQPA